MLHWAKIPSCSPLLQVMWQLFLVLLRVPVEYNRAVCKHLEKNIKAQLLNFRCTLFRLFLTPDQAQAQFCIQTHPDRDGSYWKTYDGQHAEASSPRAFHQSIAAKRTGDSEYCPNIGLKNEVVEDASSHHISTTWG